jgi:two-component SAPR family response regulator
MPNMNGIELHYKTQKIDDKVKVCYISAYELDYIRLRECIIAFEHQDRSLS